MPFTAEIFHAIERKLAYRKQHPDSLSNAELAVWE
jgi:hypothetical protein